MGHFIVRHLLLKTTIKQTKRIIKKKKERKGSNFMQQHQTVLVLDFGGQYNQLIARRIRENNVYCELVPHTIALDEIKKIAPIGIVFTGGPNSVYEADAPDIDDGIFALGIPILGICYGQQLIA